MNEGHRPAARDELEANIEQGPWKARMLLPQKTVRKHLLPQALLPPHGNSRGAPGPSSPALAKGFFRAPTEGHVTARYI